MGARSLWVPPCTLVGFCAVSGVFNLLTILDQLLPVGVVILSLVKKLTHHSQRRGICPEF